MDYWSVGFLRDFTMHELSKTGDSEKRQLLTELTLISRNEGASGGVFDLNYIIIIRGVGEQSPIILTIILFGL
jgi:hypothetical protein